MRHQVLTFKN